MRKCIEALDVMEPLALVLVGLAVPGTLVLIVVALILGSGCATLTPVQFDDGAGPVPDETYVCHRPPLGEPRFECAVMPIACRGVPQGTLR